MKKQYTNPDGSVVTIEIGDFSKIGDGTTIGIWAKIGNLSKIGNFSKIGKCTKIGDGTTIGNFAKIPPNTIINRSLLIDYSCRYVVNEAGAGLIRIGCEIFPYEQLEQKFDEFDTPENHRARYRIAVERIRAYAEAWPLDCVEPLTEKETA